MEKRLFIEALGIKIPWKIKSIDFNSKENRLDINIDFIRGATFEYEDPNTKECDSYKVYDTIPKTWRHLNFFQYACYLNVRVPRIKPKSGGIKMIFPSFTGHTYGFTLLFEALILTLIKHAPVSQIGKIFNISDYKIWRLADCYVSKALLFEDQSDVEKVGCDETALKKGHNYISLFVDLIKKKTIFVTEGKSSKTVKDFALALEQHNGNRNNIKDVSCDMSPAFIKGVREEFSEAKITFDKFHIIKIINAGVDEVRRQEVQTNPILKGARYTLLKNNSNLTAKQKEQKTRLSSLNLKSIKALHIRENFQSIYQAKTLDEFKKLLKEWYFWASHSKLKPMIKAAKMVKNHWDGILRWKESQINNGILEGLNSIIQAAKRKARGYKFNHFKTMVYLLTGKLNFNKLNSELPTCF